LDVHENEIGSVCAGLVHGITPGRDDADHRIPERTQLAPDVLRHHHFVIDDQNFFLCHGSTEQPVLAASRQALRITHVSIRRLMPSAERN